MNKINIDDLKDLSMAYKLVSIFLQSGDSDFLTIWWDVHPDFRSETPECLGQQIVAELWGLA